MAIESSALDEQRTLAAESAEGECDQLIGVDEATTDSASEQRRRRHHYHHHHHDSTLPRARLLAKLFTKLGPSAKSFTKKVYDEFSFQSQDLPAFIDENEQSQVGGETGEQQFDGPHHRASYEFLHDQTNDIVNNKSNRLKFEQRAINQFQRNASHPKASRRRSSDFSTIGSSSSSSLSSQTRRNSRRKCLRKLLILALSISLLMISGLLLAKLLTLVNRQRLHLLNGGVGGDDGNSIGSEATSVDTQLQPAADEPPINEFELEMGKAQRWLVSSSKCHIPNIDAWHKSILGYVKVKPELNCTDILLKNGTKQGALTFVRSNRLFFTRQALELGALRALGRQQQRLGRQQQHQQQRLPCCYRQVVRSEDNDDDLVFNTTCTSIHENGLLAPAEVVKVECPSFNYTNVHAFIVHDKEEESSLARVRSRLKLPEDQYYNVVLVGVDTISRLNGYRQLNKTLQLLQDKYQTLEFSGYNKVGENTFPNLIPFLSGLKPEQLTETHCWLASNYSQETERGDDFLDNCKYLWNYYQEFGYITYFSEDWPKASTFNYLKQGFKRPPTVHYGRPFTLARDDLLLPPTRMGCTSCLLDQPIVELDLANLKSFIHEHHKTPHFAFHWINCPQHDDLNGASQVDNLLEKFFADIHKATNLERTFVVFFSDHGYRWNDFVSTRVGHYESSLPLMTIAAPKHFIENHPQLYANLQSHQRALLTPFDMFKTLVDIRNLAVGGGSSARAAEPGGAQRLMSKRVGGKNHDGSSSNLTTLARNRRKAITVIDVSTSTTTKSPLDELAYVSGPTASSTVSQLQHFDGTSFKQDFRTISLLAKHNSTALDRSCIEAGIPDNYCVCHEFKKASKSTNDVLGAAYYLVYVHLYTRIEEYSELCHELELASIMEAEMFDFKQMKTTKSRRRRRRKRDDGELATEQETPNEPTSLDTTNTSPEEVTPPTTSESTATELIIDEAKFLPNREYNLRVFTKPGNALFQEVVRFYGDSLERCMASVEESKEIIENPHMDPKSKYTSVIRANEVCKFSIHSDSISRLNLYKGQSDCVKNNIELKKICYCKDLMANN